MNDKKVVGLALGGVGGFNAHDAGVLAAAYECGLRPDIITCTSGAIFWTHLFLTNPGGIREEVERQAGAVKGASALQVAVLIAVAVARGIHFHATVGGIAWFAAASVI